MEEVICPWCDETILIEHEGDDDWEQECPTCQRQIQIHAEMYFDFTCSKVIAESEAS